MSVAVYRQLTAVYAEQVALLEQPQVNIAALQDLIIRAEELLSQVDEPREDNDLAQAAADAVAAQRAANAGLERHRETLRRAAVGIQRGADAIRAYGSPADKQNARFFDQRH